MSLEQSEEIACIFTFCYQKLRVDRKYWGLHPGHSTFKLTISHKGINGINHFCNGDTNSGNS